MKNFVASFLTFLCLSIYANVYTTTAQTMTITNQGVYRLSEANLNLNAFQTIENDSYNERIFILILDSNMNILQTIRLWPQSKKFQLVPLNDECIIIVLGNGKVVIS